MKKIDFSKVTVELKFGQPETLDMRHELGNVINQSTHDIAVADLARKIYYSEGPVEIPAGQLAPLVSIIHSTTLLVYAAKVSILELLKPEQETNKE